MMERRTCHSQAPNRFRSLPIVAELDTVLCSRAWAGVETLSRTYIDFEILLVCSLATGVEGGWFSHRLVIFKSGVGLTCCRRLK